MEFLDIDNFWLGNVNYMNGMYLFIKYMFFVSLWCYLYMKLDFCGNLIMVK